MTIPNEKHISFFNAEIRQKLDEWEGYLNTQMKVLIAEKRLFVAQIWGIEENSQMLILKFKKAAIPRINTPYFMGIVGPDAVGNSSTWAFTYHDFRFNKEKKYWTERGDGIIPINYWKIEGEFAFIFVEIENSDFLDYLKKTFVDKNKHPIVVVAESDPPIKYLINLRDFISENPDSEIINLDINPIEENWKPINLDNEEDISEDILELIENESLTIIQGPPGTGKSYLAAKICSDYIKRNKTIAVTALANKALTEIATQDGLSNDLIKGRIYKTNISSRERRQYPSLKKVEEFLPKQGELLLTSYYKLSEYYKKFSEHGKRFDLIIIEEASQAFLASIALFSHFAEKILIIGDHKQLPPIVSLGEKELNRIHPKLTRVINGLETTTFNKPEISYRLTKTRRLTSKSAALTGIYYDNELESISSLNGKIVHQTSYQSLFDKEGGVSIAYLPALQIGFKENDLIKLIIDIAISLLGKERNESITICASKVADEAKLFQAYNLVSHDFTNINISTVHRIQGVTTDYTIFYMPLDAPHMDLNDNLFNVASSRAKKGTLIITKKHICLMVGKSKEIEEFLKNCHNVTEEFMNNLTKDIEF